MATIGVGQLTVALVESIDVYGQFVRMQRESTQPDVMAAFCFFDQVGLTPPSRPPTTAERKAVLTIAALSANPSLALPRNSNAVDVTASAYLKDAFGVVVDYRSTLGAPERLAQVVIAGATPAIYVMTASPFNVAQDYGAIPPDLPGGTYWDPPPPDSHPYYDVVNMPSATADPGSVPGEPGATEPNTGTTEGPEG